MAEVQVKNIDAMTVMSLPFTGPYERTQDKLEELMAWLLRMGHPFAGHPLGLYYDDPSKVAADSLRAEVCLPIEETCEPAEEIQRKRLPAVTVACVVHNGPYADIAQRYGEIFQWIQANGYRYLEGQPTREVFLKVIGEANEPSEFVTEVQVPVENV